jgi:hypothetical protein
MLKFPDEGAGILALLVLLGLTIGTYTDLFSTLIVTQHYR